MAEAYKDDTRKNKVSLYTAGTVTTIVAKGCVYIQDTFKCNPDLLTIQFEDLGLRFDRNQFRLDEE